MDTAAPATKPDIALDAVDSSAGRSASAPPTATAEETLPGSLEPAVEGSVSPANNEETEIGMVSGGWSRESKQH